MPAYQSFTLNEAIKRMERYCAYQERCHKEVRDKLQQMRMIPEAVDHVLAHLIQNDFLNEQRFANSFVNGKFSIKKWGRNRILNELKRRDISPYTITNALKAIEQDEYLIVFNTLAQKKWQQLTDSDLQKKKRKLANYLSYRGWENGLVFPKIEELAKRS
ncbi:MAG: regulatory protein RecX [Bacteroidota bacterium]